MTIIDKVADAMGLGKDEPPLPPRPVAPLRRPGAAYSPEAAPLRPRAAHSPTEAEQKLHTLIEALDSDALKQANETARKVEDFIHAIATRQRVLLHAINYHMEIAKAGTAAMKTAANICDEGIAVYARSPQLQTGPAARSEQTTPAPDKPAPAPTWAALQNEAETDDRVAPERS